MVSYRYSRAVKSIGKLIEQLIKTHSDSAKIDPLDERASKAFAEVEKAKERRREVERKREADLEIKRQREEVKESKKREKEEKEASKKAVAAEAAATAAALLAEKEKLAQEQQLRKVRLCIQSHTYLHFLAIQYFFSQYEN